MFNLLTAQGPSAAATATSIARDLAVHDAAVDPCAISVTIGNLATVVRADGDCDEVDASEFVTK